MVETSRTVLCFEPAFDARATVDVLDAWTDVDGFDAHVAVDDVAADVAAGRATSIGGRFGSIAATVLVNDKTPEGLPALPHLDVDLREQYYVPGRVDPDAVETHVDDYADLVARLHERARGVGHEPLYALGADPNQLAALFGDGPGPVATTRDGVLDGRLEQLYWLQVLPPAMVEEVGRNALLDAPAWRVDELPSGAVLLVAYPNPHQPDFDAVSRIEDAVGVDLPTYWV